MKIKLNKSFLLAGLMLMANGCGGSGGNGLGDQIDAMGRSAINTATIQTFTDDATRGAAQNDYNTTVDSGRARFAADIAGSLAIYDSLVGTCGDNPLTNRASANPADGLATGPGRYDFLAGVLADDRLYVNSASGGAEGGQCAQYLAVELGVVGVDGLAADCGGRTPTQDTIQTTYSAVAIGAVTGVDDGIAADNRTHSSTVFPFLAPPVF